MFLAEVLEVQIHDKKSTEPVQNITQQSEDGGLRASVISTDGESVDAELKGKSPALPDTVPSAMQKQIEPRPLIIAKRLLVSLTDLQAISGLAIILTGMARYPSITYYHEQFASNLWWLTLNSLWVSRIDYNDNTEF